MKEEKTDKTYRRWKLADGLRVAAVACFMCSLVMLGFVFLAVLARISANRDPAAFQTWWIVIRLSFVLFVALFVIAPSLKVAEYLLKKRLLRPFERVLNES